MSTAALLAWCFGAAAVMAAVLFGAAGRLDVPALWAFIGLWFMASLVGGLAADRTLAQERIRPGPGARENFTVAALLANSIVVSHLLLAGLDVGRFHWSDTVPLPLQIAGFVALGVSLAVLGWATSVNRFFSSVIRIQSERGHHVISSGPYRYVRHPGYAAAIVMALSSSLALGSWISILPSLFGIAVLIGRTAREDGILHKHLPGYVEYAERVRYRLVPGLW